MFTICGGRGGVAHPSKSMFTYRCRFYAALNNKKAISSDADNEVGHRRHRRAIITLLGVIYSHDGGPKKLSNTDNISKEVREFIELLCRTQAATPPIYFQAF